jgi:hypothetical protein
LALSGGAVAAMCRSRRIIMLARDLSVIHVCAWASQVMLQLFNQINARKLHGERDVFQGLFEVTDLPKTPQTPSPKPSKPQT